MARRSASASCELTCELTYELTARVAIAAHIFEGLAGVEGILRAPRRQMGRIPSFPGHMAPI